MKKYYAEIDKLRGVAILMVILYHAIIVFPLDLHAVKWCRILYEFLWYMEMPLFFIVSGFCFSCPENHYRTYFTRKARRLLIPHFAFGILELGPRIIPNPLVNEQADVKDALTDLLFYGGGDWFLWTLFILFLFFPLLHRLYQSGTAGKTAVLLGSIILYLYSYRMTNFLLIKMAAWFLVYFTAGYVIRQMDYDRLKGRMLKNPWTAGAGLLVMLLAFGWSRMKTDPALPDLFLLLGVLGGTYFFWMAAVKIEGLPERFLKLCGTYSLQMYLTGGYALVATRTLLVSILGIRIPVVIILANFILDLILTLGISHFILKRFRILKILSGFN